MSRPIDANIAIEKIQTAMEEAFETRCVLSPHEITSIAIKAVNDMPTLLMQDQPPSAQGWISSDITPQENGDYLVAVAHDDKYKVYEASYETDGNLWLKYYYGYDDYEIERINVAYWMPYPAPQKSKRRRCFLLSHPIILVAKKQQYLFSKLKKKHLLI